MLRPKGRDVKRESGAVVRGVRGCAPPHFRTFAVLTFRTPAPSHPRTLVRYTPRQS